MRITHLNRLVTVVVVAVVLASTSAWSQQATGAEAAEAGPAATPVSDASKSTQAPSPAPASTAQSTTGATPGPVLEQANSTLSFVATGLATAKGVAPLIGVRWTQHIEEDWALLAQLQSLLVVSTLTVGANWYLTGEERKFYVTAQAGASVNLLAKYSSGVGLYSFAGVGLESSFGSFVLNVEVGPSMIQREVDASRDDDSDANRETVFGGVVHVTFGKRF
ncbi:MAG: hypothetical protein CMH53_07190 [Myxococcales bacterium]|nr:hypothetical protein [Myxococcales bacterium]